MCSLPNQAITDLERDQIVQTINKSAVFKVHTAQFLATKKATAKGINLVLVVDRRERFWTMKSINTHKFNLLKTLSSCGINLNKLLLVRVRVDRLKYDTTIASRSASNPMIEVKFLDKATRFKNPTIFLLEERPNYNKAFALTTSSIKRAAGFRMDWANLVNTAWITGNHSAYTSAPNATKTYSVVSHELAHIIGDLKHISSNTPNLMNNLDVKETKNHALTKQQCAAIIKHQKL